MKYLSAFLCFFIASCQAYESNAITPQMYSREYMPYIDKMDTSTLILSDATIWKKLDPQENLSEKWNLHDQLIVRWDPIQLNYFLQNQNLSQNSTRVDLVKPSDVTITKLDEHNLTLSDGSTFSYIPFLKTVHVGENVLISLNENEPGKIYPYFIIGFTNENSEWIMSGEVQARLQ